MSPKCQIWVFLTFYYDLYVLQDLIKDLKSEISGNFEDLALDLLTPAAEYDAKCIEEAMEVSY